MHEGLDHFLNLSATAASKAFHKCSSLACSIWQRLGQSKAGKEPMMNPFAVYLPRNEPPAADPRRRLLDNCVVVNESIDIDNDAGDWEDLEFAELRAANQQAAPAQANQMAAQDAAAGAAEDIDPRPPQQAAPNQAEQAEQAAPAEANQMAAQDAAPAVVEDADQFAVELAALIAAGQARPATARRADLVQVDAVVRAPPQGGLAASVFCLGYRLYKASKSLRLRAADELPVLPQDDIGKRWRAHSITVVE